jgi:hypothetical protein
VFPALFPTCSHSHPSGFLEFPVFWISWSDLYGRNALIVAIYSTTRNTGNSGNRIETARVGLGSHAEQNVEHWERGSGIRQHRLMVEGSRFCANQRRGSTQLRSRR